MEDIYIMVSSPEHVICSAIWWSNGLKYEHQPKNIPSGIVVCGYRHCDCFVTLRAIPSIDYKQTVQGFLTSAGRFVEREEAARIFRATVGEPDNLKHLYSEDLY